MSDSRGAARLSYAAVVEQFSCRQGSAAAQCVTFYWGQAGSNFNKQQFAPWDATKAAEFCMSWEANNNGKASVVDVFAAAPCGAGK